ncbi:ABC transporter permease [Alloalcanivorax gelatiniphagus]
MPGPDGMAGVSSADQVRAAYRGLRSRTARSALSSLGISIGIAALVAVVGISGAGRAELIAELDRLGTNLLTVSPGSTLGGGRSELPPTARAGVSRLEGVESASSVSDLGLTARRSELVPATHTGGLSVSAVEEGLLDTVGIDVAAGRFLDGVTSRLPVAVLGARAAFQLGVSDLRARPTVFVGGTYLEVIGILRESVLAPELDRAVLTGRGGAELLLGETPPASMLYVRADVERVDQVQRVLGRAAHPERPEETSVSRPSDALAARAAAGEALTRLMLVLGAVALVVGGLGIANVMIISVLERRREIGLRRSLGATSRNIRLQFLLESLMLSGLGGSCGALLGLGTTFAYAVARGAETPVPWTACGAGVVAAVVVGAVAGLYPASRAAHLPPTEALRAV